MLRCSNGTDNDNRWLQGKGRIGVWHILSDHARVYQTVFTLDTEWLFVKSTEFSDWQTHSCDDVYIGLGYTAKLFNWRGSLSSLTIAPCRRSQRIARDAFIVFTVDFPVTSHVTLVSTK